MLICISSDRAFGGQTSQTRAPHQNSTAASIDRQTVEILLKPTVLTGYKSYSGSGLPAADDPGSRSWCLDLSFEQCMSGFAQRGSKHRRLQGLEVVDCFAYTCCPKPTVESASIQSALDLKVPAFSH